MLILHKTWPERESYVGTPAEPMLFHRWLTGECDSTPVLDSVLTVSSVREFLGQFQHLLNPQEKSDKPSNQRREMRVDNQVNVLLQNASTSVDGNLVANLGRGKTLDLCVHGMRIRVSSEIPMGNDIDIMVTPGGFPLTVYQLTGSPQWITREADGSYLVGFSVREDKDFERWQREFGDRFVRRNKPRG